MLITNYRLCYDFSRRQPSCGKSLRIDIVTERACEWFALVTCLVMGLSHLVQPRAWAESYAGLHRLGKPGAFINGGMSLIPGALFVAAHPVWYGPGAALTVFGWLLVLKGTICFLAPGLALRGMGKAGAGAGREFIFGGVLLLGFAGVVGYALWAG
jgi:hypothetical protein